MLLRRFLFLYRRAVRKIFLSETEENNINTCNESSRPLLISFSGHVHRSQTRRDLYDLRNESAGIVILKSGEKSSLLPMEDNIEKFEVLGKLSSFSAAGRGDNLFSYRFSEVIASGSIPVVYADDLLLPFGKELVNWTDAAVVIREVDTNYTVQILSQIPYEARCLKRKKLRTIHKNYLQTGRGVIRGIIETLELRFKQFINASLM
jgi:Exostosin family